MATILKSGNSHKATFANDFVTYGYDGYGNYTVYATVYMDDNRDNTVKLAIADDRRDGSKRGTTLSKEISLAGTIQGRSISISNAYTKASATGSVFLNAGKGARVTWLAAEPAAQAVAAPAPKAKAKRSRKTA